MLKECGRDCKHLYLTHIEIQAQLYEVQTITFLCFQTKIKIRCLDQVLIFNTKSILEMFYLQIRKCTTCSIVEKHERTIQSKLKLLRYIMENMLFPYLFPSPILSRSNYCDVHSIR